VPLPADTVGRTAGPVTTVVDAARVKAYTAATNDDHPACATGEAVPPVFAVTPSWDLVMDLVQGVVPLEQQVMIVHGWQDMHFARALRVGETLVSRGEVHSIRGNRLGTELVVRATTCDAEGAPVVDIYTTSVIRGLVDDDDIGPDRPVHVVPRDERGEKLADVVRHVDPNQTYRYREASGDTMPIHVDAELARRVGLPGIIIHGLCTMAMCGQAVLHAAGGAHPSELRRLAVRFTRPVLPDSDIVVSVHTPAPVEGGHRYAFEAKSRAKVVVKDGVAILGPPADPRPRP
jgi:acyl dehydratase